VSAAFERRQGPFLVSDDRSRLDLSVIHGFLRTAYWSTGVPVDVVERAVEGSLCFGLFEHDRQVGFARAITDRATYAYLADVFVLPSHRDRGLGRWLMSCVMAHPDLQGLRRFSLVTRDAHALYRPFGFDALAKPDRYMERFVPDVYAREEEAS
jgi:GNAT superfamily N-acetyltransferase